MQIYTSKNIILYPHWGGKLFSISYHMSAIGGLQLYVREMDLFPSCLLHTAKQCHTVPFLSEAESDLRIRSWAARPIQSSTLEKKWLPLASPKRLSFCGSESTWPWCPHSRLFTASIRYEVLVVIVCNCMQLWWSWILMPSLPCQLFLFRKDTPWLPQKQEIRG